MTKLHEIFLPIPNFKGYYEISNFGNVKSTLRQIIRSDGRTQTVKERILKSGTGTNGYSYIVARLEDKSFTIYIHRVVALVFVSNETLKPCVNHKDCNKKNNHYSNLEWVTLKENSQHAIKNGLVSACWTGKKLSKEHTQSISNGLKKHYETHLHWSKTDKLNLHKSCP